MWLSAQDFFSLFSSQLISACFAGMGLLNKIALFFDEQFWDFRGFDFSGVLADDVNTAGEFFQWWDMSKPMKKPVLLALITGHCAEQVEKVRAYTFCSFERFFFAVFFFFAFFYIPANLSYYSFV